MALASLLLLSLFLRLSPLTRFLYWGADIGEYYRIAKGLVSAGQIDLDYRGWGITYPYFPSMFFLNAVATFNGAPLELSVDLIAPSIAVLTIVAVFLLTVRMGGGEGAGLFAAAIIGLSMPHIYSTSHAIPASLGDVLFTFSLLSFVRLSEDRRWLALLLPVSAALIMSHHLSAYFLLIAMPTAMVLEGLLVRRTRWRSIRMQISFFALYTAMTLVYWLGYAKPFRDSVLTAIEIVPWYVLIALFLAGLVIATVAVLVRQKSAFSWRPTFPTGRWTLFVLTAALAFAFGLTISASAVGVPGTSVRLHPFTGLYFSPLLITLSLASPGRRLVDFSRGGHNVTAWLLAIAFSMLLGGVVAPNILLPYRHVEYLLIPLSIFAGLGAERLHSRVSRRGGTVLVFLFAFLLIGSAASSFPTPEILAGYQEGIKPEALPGVLWAPNLGDGLAAADHRVSTLLFGFGDTNATWDSATLALHAESFEDAKDEMHRVKSPSGDRTVEYVVIDVDMVAGVQLYPWDPAYPLSNAALEKFSREPYQKLFDNGYTVAYIVNEGLVS